MTAKLPEVINLADGARRKVLLAVRDAAREVARQAQDELNEIAARETIAREEMRQAAISERRRQRIPSGDMLTKNERDRLIYAAWLAGGERAKHKNLALEFGISKFYVAQVIRRGELLVENWCRSEDWRHRRAVRFQDYLYARRPFGDDSVIRSPAEALELSKSWHSDE